jgi:hypothetical protein
MARLRGAGTCVWSFCFSKTKDLWQNMPCVFVGFDSDIFASWIAWNQNDGERSFMLSRVPSDFVFPRHSTKVMLLQNPRHQKGKVHGQDGDPLICYLHHNTHSQFSLLDQF